MSAKTVNKKKFKIDEDSVYLQRDDIQVINNRVLAIFNFDRVIARGTSIAVTYHVVQQFLDRYYRQITSPALALATIKDHLDEAGSYERNGQGTIYYENKGMTYVVGTNYANKYRVITCFQC